MVRTVADTTEPSMEPMPPRTTMTRISTDFMKPNLAGAMTPMQPAYRPPPTPAKNAETTKASVL